MDVDSAARLCALRGIAAGRAIRAAVHAMDPVERARPTTSRLKAKNVAVDASAEAIGLEHLSALAADIGRRILLLLDGGGTVETIGSDTGGEVVWACFDAIDGTKKVAGIRPPGAGRVDVANDGVWAATFAFTAPTAKRFEDLVLGDFTAAAIVDGNPSRYRTYPQEVVTFPDASGAVTSWEIDGQVERRLYTSSAEGLTDCWAYLDSFQAYDRDSQQPGDEELAVELYRLLINRHSATGAHDVLRQFGSLSALCRNMLGWREEPLWRESQGGAFFVVNENLPNLIPAVLVIAGAGGVSVDFDARPLLERPLRAGRTSVIHAANPALRDHCARVVQAARTA